MQLSWSIEGDQQLLRKLQMVSSGIKDFSDPFRQTAEYLADTFEKTFDVQGRNIGVIWPPLAASTIRQKAKNAPGAPMLVRTGAMRASFQKVYATDYARVWNSATYFKYHQSKQPRTKIPRRQMMNLAEEQKQTIVKFFHTYVQKIMSK